MMQQPVTHQEPEYQEDDPRGEISYAPRNCSTLTARTWSRDGATGKLKGRDWKATESTTRTNHSRTATMVRPTKGNGGTSNKRQRWYVRQKATVLRPTKGNVDTSDKR